MHRESQGIMVVPYSSVYDSLENGSFTGGDNSFSEYCPICLYLKSRFIVVNTPIEVRNHYDGMLLFCPFLLQVSSTAKYIHYEIGRFVFPLICPLFPFQCSHVRKKGFIGIPQ